MVPSTEEAEAPHGLVMSRERIQSPIRVRSSATGNVLLVVRAMAKAVNKPAKPYFSALGEASNRIVAAQD